jgi:methyl-accepting chemotaxis protein
MSQLKILSSEGARVPVKQSTINFIAGGTLLAASVGLGGGIYVTQHAVHDEQQAVARQAEFKQLGLDFVSFSDYLTDEARKYVVTTDSTHLTNYWTAINVTQTDQKIITRLKELGAPQNELDLIQQSKDSSDALVNTEARAQRLVLEAMGTPQSRMPADLVSVKLSDADEALDSETKLATARSIMFDANYEHARETIMAPITRFVNTMNTRAENAVAAARAMSNLAIQGLIALAVVIPLGLLAVLVSFQRLLGGSIDRYVRGLRGRAHGDLEFTLEPGGTIELRQLADAFNEQFRENARQAQTNAELMETFVEVARQVTQSAGQVSDLSEQFADNTKQVGAAVQQVTMAVQNVASGAQETSRSAQETTAAVGQLSQVIDGIARGANDQARQVQTTSATATQMAAGIEQVAADANQVASASQQAKIVAERGGQAVRETTAAMNEIQVVVGQAASKVRELGTLGQKIGAVVETIDDIAEQTNLLALNAAIEAARAGEHGKGFAVVADEVRKLAERSGRETKQISELIAQVQTGTKDAVGAMDSGAAKVELGSQKAVQAGQALEEILVAVQETVRQVGEIASSSQQMAGGARSVTDAMQSISAVVEESTAATEEMAAQAAAVSGSISSIAAVSEQQSAATEEVSASTEEMSAQVEQMSAQAQQLAATAEQLKGLVARFEVADHDAPAATSARRSTAKSGAPLRRVA